MTVSHPTFEVEIHPMEVKQIYTGCLAQGAYYIESNGEAAIVDPLREVQPYLDLAKTAAPQSNMCWKPTSTPTLCRAT